MHSKFPEVSSDNLQTPKDMPRLGKLSARSSDGEMQASSRSDTDQSAPLCGITESSVTNISHNRSSTNTRGNIKKSQQESRRPK